MASKVLIFLVLVMSQAVWAQSGVLEGVVSDPAHPVPGVTIIISGTNLGAVSGTDGSYQIRNIRPGSYSVRFSAIGYQTQTAEVEINASVRRKLDILLNPSVIVTDEIQVVGDKRQKQEDTRVSVIDLRPESARILPGAVQDVMRTLQSLPGVLAPNDFTSQLVIRGSGPDQNLIIMDDVEIFNPYRLYGVISMFNPEAVSDINLITGGFPAKYGDRLSAALDVTNREGARNKNLTGNINASIVDANLVLEGKNPLNVQGSWLINSRRTYYDLIIEPFVKKAGLVDQDVTFPNFYDVQGKFVFGPFNGHKFLINGIYSRDGVNVVSGSKRKTADSISVQNISRNDLASFAWHYSPSDKLLNKFIVSWYRNGGDSEFEAQVLDPSLNREKYKDVLPDTLSPYLLGISVTSDFSFRKYAVDDKFTYLWGENQLEAGAGVDFMQNELNFNFNISPELKALINSNSGRRAVPSNLADIRSYKRYRSYLQNRFKFGTSLYLEPGLRMDYYDILKKIYFAPRISASYALDELTTLRGLWGIYYQSPGYEKLRDANVLFDLSPRYTNALNAEKSIHYVLSLERWLNAEWRSRLEGYYKSFSNLIVQQRVSGTRYYTEPVPGKDPRYTDAWTRPIPFTGDSLTQVPVNNSNGEAYGFELIIEKKNSASGDRLSGWISYALAWADRYEDGFTIPFRYDQRHTVNFVLNYRYNEWLNIGLRWQYGSGFPYTIPNGIKPRIILTDANHDGVPETPEIATRSYFKQGGRQEVIYDIDYGGDANRFNAYKPAYHRLDVRFTALTKIWGLDWSFYLDVINAYNRSNVIGYSYFVNDDLTMGQRKSVMLPIIPTFGFSVKF